MNAPIISDVEGLVLVEKSRQNLAEAYTRIQDLRSLSPRAYQSLWPVLRRLGRQQQRIDQAIDTQIYHPFRRFQSSQAGQLGFAWLVLGGAAAVTLLGSIWGWAWKHHEETELAKQQVESIAACIENMVSAGIPRDQAERECSSLWSGKPASQSLMGIAQAALWGTLGIAVLWVFLSTRKR
jgi:hypothetical protein